MEAIFNMWFFRDLSNKEKKVLHLRFIKNQTLRKIANSMNLSVERIRQIEGKTIYKLRRQFQKDRIELSDLLEIVEKSNGGGL